MKTRGRLMPLPMGSEDRQAAAYLRWRRLVDRPLLALAVALIPLLLAPFVLRTTPRVDRQLTHLDWLIWGIFAVDYVVGLVLTTGRKRYLRNEWISFLLVVLPFLRAFNLLKSTRALRLLRLTRALVVFTRFRAEFTRLLLRHRLHYALAVTFVLILGCAVLVLNFERGGEGSIQSLPDALWWAITTITTVGYGDTFPVTGAGRMVAAVLMIAGIAVFGIVTANIAAFVLERQTEHEQQEEAEEDLRHAELLARLDSITARLEALEPP